MAMSNRLASFLKEHGAYDSFMENLGSHFRGVEDFEGSRAAISRAFIWAGTPQGESYWRELDYEFRLNYYTYKPSPPKVDTTWDNMWDE